MRNAILMASAATLVVAGAALAYGCGGGNAASPGSGKGDAGVGDSGESAGDTLADAGNKSPCAP
jgi:hypothetical protein